MNTSSTGPDVNRSLDAEERALGMQSTITRRDFLNTTTLGAGAALLHTLAPSFAQGQSSPAAAASGASATPSSASGASGTAWTGYSGIGDYSRSNGNTWEVMSAGHGIRDSQYEARIAGAKATGEVFDLVVVGGGYAGVVAAYTFLKETGRKRHCLILENHPLPGGEAKRNEFNVRGTRLIGPQGSNESVVPDENEGLMAQLWKATGMPRHFEFAKLPAGRKPMEFPRDNYMYLLWADRSENHGFFFDEPTPHWVTNPWGHDLTNTPWSEHLRKEMLRWRDERNAPFQGDETALQRWLDTMTYDDFLTKHRHLDPEVARYVDSMTAAGLGLGSDVISANAAYYFTYPGFQGLSREPDHITIKDRRLPNADWIFSFPGGNDGLMRGLLKWLNPQMIQGSQSFEDIYAGHFNFQAMDDPAAACRMRMGATVVRVMDDPEKHTSQPATVVYAKEGQLFSVQAKTVIWAGASFTAKHALPNLPNDYKDAMERFTRAPILVANVALDNWRFLYKLGYTATSWRGGFGYTANLVSPMYVGDYRPALDPDSPAILSFYVPFNERGASRTQQGAVARQRMFSTSYRDYEAQIRRQMVKLFGSAGFDPQRDIAGIVLNRWGHAYVTAGPGFFYGTNGKPAPSEVLRQPLGRVAFAHSELSGHQNAGAASLEGHRAAQQILQLL